VPEYINILLEAREDYAMAPAEVMSQPTAHL
jgi:hypothetical protein